MTLPAAELLARARSRRPEAYRTERTLPKHTCGPDDGSNAGPWLPADEHMHVLTKTPNGLSDKPVEQSK